jgi:hypothetical protein
MIKGRPGSYQHVDFIERTNFRATRPVERRRAHHYPQDDRDAKVRDGSANVP